MKTKMVTIEFSNKAEFDQKVSVLESKGYYWNYTVKNNGDEKLSVTFYSTSNKNITQ